MSLVFGVLRCLVGGPKLNMSLRSVLVARPKSRLSNPDLLFSIGIALVFLITFVHTLALPLIISYDGMEYAHLANVLSGPSIISHWNFYRTPLFPLALNVAFWLGGEQPQSVLMVTTLLGTGGVLLVGLIVRRVAGPTSGAIALVLVSFYPVLIGYEHMLLSETGTFFWLTLLLWSLVCLAPVSKARPIWVACWIALVISLGYYWRPSVLSMAPIAAIGYVCALRLSPKRLRFYSELLSVLRADRRVVSGVAIIVLGPYVLSGPWIYLTAKHSRGGYSGVVAQGIFRHVLVPVDDPLLAPVKAEYQSAIKHDLVNGTLPLTGLTLGGHPELLNKVGPLLARAGVWHVIRQHPFRYIDGVAKSMIFFLGMPDRRIDDDNWKFSHAAFTVWPPSDSLDRMVGWYPKLPQFAPPRYFGGASVGRMFDYLLPVYAWLVLLSNIVSFVWMLVSLKHGDALGLVLTAVPFTLLVAHALTLHALNRYALPAYPLMLANSVIVIRLVSRDFRKKRPIEKCSGSLGGQRFPGSG